LIDIYSDWLRAKFHGNMDEEDQSLILRALLNRHFARMEREAVEAIAEKGEDGVVVAKQLLEKTYWNTLTPEECNDFKMKLKEDPDVKAAYERLNMKFADD